MQAAFPSAYGAECPCHENKDTKDEYVERLAKKARNTLDKEELVLERKRDHSVDVEDEQD